jgi:PPP family 3-phenylpropionic acid transporter
LLHIIFGLLLFIWLVSLTLPEPERSLHQQAKGSLLFILKHPTVIALLLVYLLIQISHGPYYVFYSLYVEQQGYSSTETGILWALGVLAEVVVFILMPPILARFRLKSIILWSIVLCIVRWVLIAKYANQAGVLYFAQLLHAATFGSAHVAAVHMVHRHFGRQYQGTGQALYASISFGLGGMLGSFASGWLWEQIGAELVFICAAAVCVVALLIAWFGISDEDTRTEHADLIVVEEEL